MPAISIVMPYRNAAATLPAAVDSVLAQTFTDYEFIAVNDNSEDDSETILSSYRDARLKLHSNPGYGLVDALNFALTRTGTDWIARMDADDIMHPQKLERQWQMLSCHPEIDVISCMTRLFPDHLITDGFREYINWQNRIVDHNDFINHCYVEMPLTNPTAIFRKSIWDQLGNFRSGDVPEDYEFWLRALHAGYRFMKVPEILFDWRDSERRYTRTAPACSRDAFDRVRAEYLSQDQRLSQGRPLVYCGAGRATRKRADLMIRKGFTPYAWVDIDPRKVGNKLNGIPVVTPEWILENRAARPFMLIYIASHGARDQLANWLEAHDFHVGEDYLAVG